MKKLYVLFMLAILAACNEPTPVFEKMSHDAVILAFGDSLTYGTAASRSDSYPTILSQLSAHDVINAGVPGEISKAGLSRLATLLDRHQPELLILIHGGNDILRKIPAQQTHDNLIQMINLAEQRNINVVMLGVPEPTLFLMSSAELYQKVAEQKQIPIDVNTMPHILNNTQLKSDMIHPNKEGYKLMAENIFNLLLETGAL